MKKFSLKQLKLLEDAYQKHDLKNCKVDCCIFCFMDEKKDVSNEDIIDSIVSPGSVSTDKNKE